MTHKKKQHALFESKIIRRALKDSLINQSSNQFRNLVMFVVEVGSVLTTPCLCTPLCPVRVCGVYSRYFVMAMGHGALCQFCRISGRRPRKGTG
jgi:high-affinity K+ transport system ATPase subunit B